MKFLLALLLAASLRASEPPLISLRVVGPDCYLSVISSVQFTIWQSGNCQGWWPIYTSRVPAPGEWIVFSGVDLGWAGFARRGFYCVRPTVTPTQVK